MSKALKQLVSDRDKLNQMLAANEGEVEAKRQRLVELGELCQRATPELRAHLAEQRTIRGELEDLKTESEVLQNQLDSLNDQISVLERDQFLSECRKTVAEVEKLIPAQFEKAQSALENYVEAMQELYRVAEPAIRAEGHLQAGDPIAKSLIMFPRSFKLLIPVAAGDQPDWLCRYGFKFQHFDWSPEKAQAAREAAAADLQERNDRLEELQRARQETGT